MTYRVPRWAVADLDGDRPELHWLVLQPMWHRLRTPAEPDPRLWQATLGQRALYALYLLWSETDLGGLDRFFRNPAGMLAGEAVQGARRLGLGCYAELLAEAITAAFNRPAIPQDRRVRRRTLDGPSEQQRRRLGALDQRLLVLRRAQPLDAAMDQYARGHPVSSSLTSGRRTLPRGHRPGSTWPTGW